MSIPNEILNIIFSYVERPKTKCIINDVIDEHNYNFRSVYTFSRFKSNGEEMLCDKIYYSNGGFANSYFRMYDLFKELNSFKKSFGILFKMYKYLNKGDMAIGNLTEIKYWK